MFSYKMKNYVLLDERGRDDDSRLGAAARAAWSDFQRRFMEEMFRLMLERRADEIPALL